MTYSNEHSNGHANIQSAQQPLTPGGRLRQLLESSHDIIVVPGVYDGFSARIALEVGFDCIYMVSMMLHDSQIFRADIGINRLAQAHVLRSWGSLILVWQRSMTCESTPK